MKKALVLFLAGACMFISALDSLAQGFEKVDAAKGSEWREFYQMRNERGDVHCFVSVSENGEKIGVSVDQYYDNGECYHQYVEIHSTGIVEKSFSVTMKTGDTLWPLDKEKYRDIFYAKCLESAKKLPPEIRAMFHGQWGL